MVGPAPVGEAFGLFALEAMAAGVPVVLSASGGFPELVKMTGGGVTYTPNAPEVLAAVLAELLSDPTRLRILGQGGRNAAATHFTLCRMAADMAAVSAEFSSGQAAVTL
jgi:glycosyltransferase involved in cell wall biosynthesis